MFPMFRGGTLANQQNFNTYELNKTGNIFIDYGPIMFPLLPINVTVFLGFAILHCKIVENYSKIKFPYPS